CAPACSSPPAPRGRRSTLTATGSAAPARLTAAARDAAPRLAGERRGAGVGALLILLAGAAAAADRADDPAAARDRSAAERRQDLALQHRWGDRPEAALRDQIGQFGGPLPERRGRPRPRPPRLPTHE